MAPIDRATQLYRYIANPLANTTFRFDSLAVAGFFGGDIAVNGMATVIFFWRGWGGLYNTPGSLNIARRYGQLATTPRIYKGLFPGDTRDPSRLFGLDGKSGPKFLSPHSGSLFEKTGHIGHLFALLAEREPYESVRRLAKTEPQRITAPTTVTIIDLNHLDPSKPDVFMYPSLPHPSYGLFALIPTIVSCCACIACGIVGDWWCFSSILLGMVANGCACYVLGLGRVAFQHPEPAVNTHPADGILWAADNAVVVIRGKARALNTITRGRFFLHYRDAPSSSRIDDPLDAASASDSHRTLAGDMASLVSGAPTVVLPSSSPIVTPQDVAAAPPTNGAPDGEGTRKWGLKPEKDGAPEGGKPNSFWIGFSSILLVVQFLAQLLVVPQVTFFGQLMFVCTLACSWAYNVFLSSIDREDIQIWILRDIFELREESENGRGKAPDREGRGRWPVKIQKFEFGTWTTMATFACLALRPDPATPLPNPSKILDALIPNDTEEWRDWKAVVNNALSAADLGELEEPDEGASKLVLRKAIVGDARVAFQRYRKVFEPREENDDSMDNV